MQRSPQRKNSAFTPLLSTLPLRPAALFLAAVIWAAASAASLGQESFDDAAGQGQLALDTARLDEASALFERALAIDPTRAAEVASDRAWTYMRLGNDALATGDNETADRCYTMAAAIYPEYKKVFKNQWAYSRLAQTQEAVEQASKNPRRADWNSMERDLMWVQSLKPGDADVHFALGTLYQIQGKKDKARREYAAALGGTPVPANRSMNSLREEVSRGLRGRKYLFDLRPVYPPRQESDAGPFQEYREDAFLIHHHNADLAARVAAALEYYLGLPVLDGVLASPGPFPDECKVYIFADEEEFQATGGKEKWAGAQSKLIVLNGKILSATIHIFQTTPELTESAVPHELTHIRLAASPYFFTHMPLWLQEGVATSTESRYKKFNAAAVLLRAYDQGILISLNELFAMTAYPKDGTSDIFYAEGLAVVESLVDKYGKQRFWAFMSQLRDTDADAALRQVYGLTVANVEDVVIEWASARERPKL